MLTNSDISNPVTGLAIAAVLFVAFVLWKSTSHSGEKTPQLFGVFALLAMFAGLAAIFVDAGPMLTKVMTMMNPLTVGFIGVITMFALYFHCCYSQTIAHKAPAFLTTLGILGTFLGVAIGLSAFDPNDIQKSVPALIEGMKTAFWASACGIFFAVTIKLRDMMTASQQQKMAPKTATATVNDLVTQMSSLLMEAQIARRDANDRLDRLNALMLKVADMEDGRVAFARAPKLELVG